MNKTVFKLTVWCLISMFVMALLSSCRTMEGMPENVFVEPDNPEEIISRNLDSVTMVATTIYDCGMIKPIFQGSNYRKAWSTPIRVPVVYLDTLRGGLTPLEKGGGLQTLSMDLEDKTGVVYTLRSVNKNPDPAVPEFAKKANLENIVKDAMSAQHPYGAIVAAELADATGVQHTHPQIVYVPDQAALDTFSEEFGNKLFLLEYEPEGKGSWSPLDCTEEIIDTEDVQELLYENENARIDERALVRARLFDLLIGDWDRHAKQWGWFVTNRDSQIVCHPLPTDRDNAFYNPGGLIPWTITRPMFTPFLRPFRKKIDHVPGMITAFDQYFLLDVPVEVFEEVALEIQHELTDEEIEQAFKVWPKEFYETDAEKMIRFIKARKKDLPKYAVKMKKAIEDRGPLKKPLKGSSKLYAKN